MEENIEKKVTEAVLQKAAEVIMGNRTYKVAQPTIATLILVSEAISRLPSVKLSEKKLVEGSLAMAQDCAALGEIVAIFILGARGLSETVRETQTREKRYLFGLIRRKYEVEVERVIDRKAELAKEILETVSPQELHRAVTQILWSMEITDFFGLITFLIEVNLLRQKKVEN